MLQFYDLVNSKGGNHFSPFAWRSLMALKHKGLQFEHNGLTFTEVDEIIPKLSDGKWSEIPLMKLDDGTVVYDSPVIADYLEKAYPDKSLFPNGRYFSSFLENLITSTYLPLLKLVILDVYGSLKDEKDIKYFRENREERFNQKLEVFAGDKKDHEQAVQNSFAPFRSTLKNTKFLEGDQVTYSDYILFGSLKVIQQVNNQVFDKIVTNHEDQVLNKWFDSIESLHEGYAKSFKP